MFDDETRLPSLKEWLDENKIKKLSYEMMMEALKEADNYLINRKMSKESIFNITDAFIVYGLLSNLTCVRNFHLLHPKTARVLNIIAPIYKNYLLFVSELKIKQILATPVIEMVDEKCNSQNSLTEQFSSISILDAVSLVLKNNILPMSVQEIYNAIIAKDLHVFELHGVQTPVQVIEAKIDESCKYSNSANIFSNPLFGFVYDGGVKKYYLLVRDIDNSKFEPIVEKHPKIETGIESLLKNHYQYGFRIESIREYMRLRDYAESDGVMLPSDDDELKSLILKCGTVIDGRVYVKSDDISQELKDMVGVIFESGVQVIYFEALFEQKSEWMSSHFITSEDMLKELLKKSASNYSYVQKYMINTNKQTEKEIVTDEIKRVWGDNQLCSVDELADRLPYIPTGIIQHIISGNVHFAHNTEGVYLDVDRLIITKQEEADILDYVEQTCEKKGFASLTEIPTGDILEQNYEPSSRAVYSAIYKRLLIDKYRMKDKILTKEGKSLDAVTLLKKYIKGKDICTFTEIADMVIELTGGANRQLAFEALYSCMVRIELNKYVADKFVNFNVAQTDEALSDIIINNFCAIKDVTTFAMFPICGMPWNHYLLESYCYRFSKKFTLNVLNFNDKNAGIIADKEYNKDYKEMLAIVAAKPGIALDAETIGKYLNQAGYLAKSKYGNLEQIAEMAKAIREEG